MELNLKGKSVLITGGSKGMGLACARGFRLEGARVAICSRSPGNVTAAEKALAAQGKALGIAADLTDAKAAAAMLDRVEREQGPIDILVSSAGAAKRTPPAELKIETWRAAMDA